MSAQAVTGFFTLGGVTLTAVVALIAAWMKYRFDRSILIRTELRELYARCMDACQELEDRMLHAHRALHESGAAGGVPTEVATSLEEAHRRLRVVFSELDITAPEAVQRAGMYLYHGYNEFYRDEAYRSADFVSTFEPAMQEHYSRFLMVVRASLATSD